MLHHIEHANKMNVTEFPEKNLTTEHAKTAENDHIIKNSVYSAVSAVKPVDDPVVLAGCLNHLSALPDVVGKRFFHVDVFACLTSHNGSKSVKVAGVALIRASTLLSSRIRRKSCTGSPRRQRRG
jgi:hypothetical protein